MRLLRAHAKNVTFLARLLQFPSFPYKHSNKHSSDVVRARTASDVVRERTAGVIVVR